MNFGSVVFALCSGFAMASRNVFMKTFQKNGINTPPSDGWKQIAVKGLFDYISITSAAAFPGTIFLIFAETQGTSQIKDRTITSFMVKSLVGKEAILFHGLYNIASISVLCLISTQSHSLLNVGKRIINVLYAGIVFRESVSFNGIPEVVMGGILYSARRNMTRTSRLFIYFLILVEMNFGSNIDFYSYSVGKSRFSPHQRGNTANTPNGESTLDSNVVIWMYPYKPPNATWYQEQLGKDAKTAFFCGFPSVCRRGINSTHAFASINLRELTTGTSYGSFVSHHFYYKVLHGKEYIHHVQSVAICSMVLLEESCYSISVNPASTTNYTERTKEGRQELLEQCREYDPTKSGTVPIFREAIERNQPYTILGYDSRVKTAAEANSGDEVQALAGLQFLPEHTMTVDRDEGYSRMKDNGTSPLLIANAWYGTQSKFPPPLPTESNNNKIVFTSLHFSGNGKKLIKLYKSYWEEYISQVGPIGARDTATLNFLQTEGLSSYLSLCFTLNFQLPRSPKLVAVDQNLEAMKF